MSFSLAFGYRHSTLIFVSYSNTINCGENRSEAITGSIGEYDPWPGGLGPKSRVERIMTRQGFSRSDIEAGIKRAGTHVRGSMRLRW